MQANAEYENLISGLVKLGVLRTEAVIRAFRTVDRAQFVRAKYLSQAYADAPLSIGQSQTISQPYTVAFMLELLAAEPGHKVLDVGCGSGWTTALLAHIVGPAGFVYGLEIRPELVRFAGDNLAAFPGLKARINILESNGHQGLRQYAPFDRILVSAAAPEIPAELVEELKPGGHLVVPVGKANGNQSIWLLAKDAAGGLSRQEFPGFIFVPLLPRI